MIIHTHKLSNLEICSNWIIIKKKFLATKLPTSSMIIGGKPGTIPDTHKAPLWMSMIPLWLCYGLGHAHKPPRFTPEILNSLKLQWWLPDHYGSSGIIMDHDGCIYGATMNHDGVQWLVIPWYTMTWTVNVWLGLLQLTGPLNGTIGSKHGQ